MHGAKSKKEYSPGVSGEWMKKEKKKHWKCWIDVEHFFLFVLFLLLCEKERTRRKNIRANENYTQTI